MIPGLRPERTTAIRGKGTNGADRPRVAFVQDHLVQRGGAERVLLAMLRAIPEAAVVTPFYEASACYPEFEAVSMRTSPLNRSKVIRAHHRATLPFLPLVMAQLKVDADVVVCGTSGWAQGVRTEGRKVIYFHGLARWLYEQEAYLKGSGLARRAAAHGLAPVLRRWDRRTVGSGDRFLAASTDMCRRVADIYGVDVGLLRYPNSLGTTGPQRAVPGVDPGFFVCASRLIAYKNVDVLIAAFAERPQERLVVAGDGPLLDELRAVAPPNVALVGRCDDDQLRWLYAESAAVITSAIEPFGLTPIEGGAFGKPTVALRAGGFLDTVVDGVTGVFFDRPDPRDVLLALRRFREIELDEAAIVANASQWDEAAFAENLRKIVADEHAAG
jgi:glycosyltransferase involved in cell wall biosynthesis